MTLLSGALRFKLALALILAAMLALVRPSHSGDVVEYSLATIALAKHGSPDIRLSDIAIGKQLIPQMNAPYDQLEAGMREGRPQLYAAFTRGRGDTVYAIHFFGYSALAALPYKALELAGLPPMKCFQIVNLAALFVLGLSLYRLFGSAGKAFLALGLFMLCGGMLYWHWSSPECLSAAGLLAALALFLSGAPVAGGLLAGLASQQNPTIVMFFGFAPLLRSLLAYRGGGWRAFLAPALEPRYLAGVGAGLALFAVPLLFNLWQYGVPNIIAKNFSQPALVSLIRLVSFYFDLNQGMLIAIPGLAAALALWNRRGETVLLGACLVFTLALAVPALAINNWNSGAAGVMRYAFWAAMPLLFALLLRLRRQARWPLGVLAGVGLVQAAAMAHAFSYSYVEFSPLARLALRLAPSHYHPEPEIFVERLQHHDNYIDSKYIYTRAVDGQIVTTLYNRLEPGIDERLCGEGRVPAADNDTVDSTLDWRYVDGTLRCVSRPD